MLAVPADRDEAKAIEKVDELAEKYLFHMGRCQMVAQQALNLLVCIGIDPSVALQIVNIKFRAFPPRDVGYSEAVEVSQNGHMDLVGSLAPRLEDDEGDEY